MSTLSSLEMRFQTSSPIGPCYSYLYLTSGACINLKSRKLLFAWYFRSADCTSHLNYFFFSFLLHGFSCWLTMSLIHSQHLYHINRPSLYHGHPTGSHFLHRLHLALNQFVHLDSSRSQYWHFVRYFFYPLPFSQISR